MPGLQFRHITVRREESGAGDGAPPKDILRDISFEVPDARITSIVGPSGVGKSTLLRLAVRLEDPAEGDVFLDSIPIRSIPILELRRRLALVFQEPHLLGLTVRENLILPLELQGGSTDQVEDRLTEVADLAQVSRDWFDFREDQLSVGQKQRVSLARALMGDPEVLLLDEPASALDLTLSVRLVDTFRALNERLALTVLFVSHSMEQVKNLGGRVVFIAEGRVIEEGGAKEILESPKDPLTRKFVNGEMEIGI